MLQQSLGGLNGWLEDLGVAPHPGLGVVNILGYRARSAPYLYQKIREFLLCVKEKPMPSLVFQIQLSTFQGLGVLLNF